MSKIGHIQPYKDGYRIFVQRYGKRKTEVFRGTHREAEIRAAQMAAELGVSNAYPDDITLEDYWAEVFPSRLSNRGKPRSTNTMDYYRRQMVKNILPKIGRETLDKLTHEQLAEVIRTSTAPLNTKRTLMAVLRSAYDDGLMREKPLERRVPVKKNPRERYLPWSLKEALNALDKLLDYDIRLALYASFGLSGLGMEEALGLRWKDFHIETMSVDVSWTYTDTGGHVEETKNAYRVRTVPVFKPARPLVASSSREQDKDKRIIPMRGDTLYHTWKKACSALGVRYIPPSNLRHTSDTIMLQSGVRGELNDKLHGRSNPSITYSAYYRPSLKELDEAAQIVGRKATELHTIAHENVENSDENIPWYPSELPF